MGDTWMCGPRTVMTDSTSHLSPYGKALLKELGGDPTREVPLTPAQVKRWAKDRPESVLNLMPDKELADLAASLPNDFFRLTEDDLKARCPEGRPSRMDRRVRLQFWNEYELAAKELREMNMQAVVEGTGALTWEAYRTEMATPGGGAALLAWFMTPPAEYALRMREATELGVERLMDILELPLKDEKGRVQVGVAALILAAYKLVSERVHGAIAQKIVQANMSVGEIPQDGKATLQIKDVDARIMELEKLLNGQQAQLSTPTTPAPGPRIEKEVTLLLDDDSEQPT